MVSFRSIILWTTFCLGRKWISQLTYLNVIHLLATSLQALFDAKSSFQIVLSLGLYIACTRLFWKRTELSNQQTRKKILIHVYDLNCLFAAIFGELNLVKEMGTVETIKKHHNLKRNPDWVLRTIFLDRCRFTLNKPPKLIMSNKCPKDNNSLQDKNLKTT